LFFLSSRASMFDSRKKHKDQGPDVFFLADVLPWVFRELRDALGRNKTN
jgi:hypothetical protein